MFTGTDFLPKRPLVTVSLKGQNRTSFGRDQAKASKSKQKQAKGSRRKQKEAKGSKRKQKEAK